METPEFTSRLFSQLKIEEGFRQFAYRDTRGLLTIGYGRNLDANGVTLAEGTLLCANDMQSADGALARTIPFYQSLDVVRRVAIADMAFNMGISSLMTFKSFLYYMSIGDYVNAAAQIKDSLYFTSPDTAKRAYRIYNMILTGAWANDIPYGI